MTATEKTYSFKISEFIKIFKTVCAFSLVDRCVKMKVCNHGCDTTLSVSPAHFKAVSLTSKYKY